MNEGKGAFTFNTVGSWPAVDVAPLPAMTGQYPFDRSAEPSYVSGGFTLNPRDGLVTLLAYTDGEEHFYDDNANGQRDANERFIDQGEPLVDANDNHQWDLGERYVDADGNGVWTAPNGQWDANAKVWTVAHLLYSGAPDPAAVSFSPSMFSVPRGTQQSVDVWVSDLNRNRLEAGATAAITRAGSKGLVSFVDSQLDLDAFGFELESRRLTNAAGTGPCDATSPVCTFRTVFGSWQHTRAGQLLLVGAPAADMTPASPDSITVTVAVKGTSASASVPGVFE